MSIFSTRVCYAVAGGAGRFELPELARNQFVFSGLVSAEMIIKQAPNELNCYRFASPADPFQMFRDSMEVRWILDRVSQSVDASKTSGD